jgi:putative aminopeptidase FrvX
MRKAFPIDTEFMIDFLVNLINIPSPTGITDNALDFIAETLDSMNLSSRRTVKGGLFTEWNGTAKDKTRALAVHVDTLGAMVKEIKSNGRLKITQVGEYNWNAIEGEGCTVIIHSGEHIRGSILSTQATFHIYGPKSDELLRSEENLEVRLDIRTSSAVETCEHGIEVGDFVTFDPRVEVNQNGFIRARHIDDKAGIACVLAAIKAMQQANIEPKQRTVFFFSNYEEVGHIAISSFPQDLTELVVIDMGAVGEGQTSDEFHTTIGAKDSWGPYHPKLTHHLIELARQADIPYKVDVFPYYGSDGQAFWRAGGDVQIALFGPGVDASHNYERTHVDSLTATAQLIVEYLRS